MTLTEEKKITAADNAPRQEGDKPVRKAVKCPQKVGINLNMREKRTRTVLSLAGGIAAVVVVVALIGKFGVYDQYARLAKAEKAYSEVHQQYETVLQELTGYDEVLTEYRTYSMDWMAGSEDGQGYQFVAVDRRDVLDLIESEMMTRGTVSSVSMRDDRVVVGMSGMSLEEISVMFSSIEQHDIVKSVELDVAETERDKPASVLSFTVNIVLNTEQDDTAAAEEAAE